MWADRTAGALAVMLFHLVPLPYGLIGNANLTNAFGQSVALIGLVLAVMLPLAGSIRAVYSSAGLFLVVSLAFLSHISTAAHLGVTLVCLSAWLMWRGDRPGRASALAVLAVTLFAAAFSWFVYYGHFTEVYATAMARLTAEAPPCRPLTGRFQGCRYAATRASTLLCRSGLPMRCI